MKKILSIIVFSGTVLFGASCNNQAEREHAAALREQQQQLDSLKYAMARQHLVDSMNAVAQARQDSITAATAVAKSSSSSTTRRRSYSSAPASSSGMTVYQGSGYSQPVVQAQPEKRGWSAKAKGAVIGAGVGAASGAIINKRNRGVGAIIGGAGGAILGTGVGAVIDKKNGR